MTLKGLRKDDCLSYYILLFILLFFIFAYHELNFGLETAVGSRVQVKKNLIDRCKYWALLMTLVNHLQT